ncbi:hypothetical protein NC653_001374 [Populus alba x Populus x berolinensis]|uniref:Uncharacterized protein n=1 Tax=Populus alba x Populus x berolinensis TaxID=444605 RepID=A0AAD6RKX9_9ROSI|nr:hypothetical protein NC653_001374 [Populus alba x Populus x berolinensis]
MWAEGISHEFVSLFYFNEPIFLSSEVALRTWKYSYLLDKRPMEMWKSIAMFFTLACEIHKLCTPSNSIVQPMEMHQIFHEKGKSYWIAVWSSLFRCVFIFQGNSVLRILNVAAFAISGYASSEGRLCKPFNPLLGETYEADFPDKGVRFFSEKVSHHPTLIACHCEVEQGIHFCVTVCAGYDRSQQRFIILSLEKCIVITMGLMHIQGNRQYSCKLKFKEQSILDRNPHQLFSIHSVSCIYRSKGSLKMFSGNKVASLIGKWDDSMHYTTGDGTGKSKDRITSSNANLALEKYKPPANLTRYNLSSFAITLNELTPGLQEKLPPTNSRLRPDQRHLENGEYEKANGEKQRLEKRQRMSRKLQEHGWNQDGSKRKVKMDLSAMLVATGKPESGETGMDVQIYLASSMKNLWNLLKGLDLMEVYINLKTAFLRFLTSATSLKTFCAGAPLFVVKREPKA